MYYSHQTLRIAIYAVALLFSRNLIALTENERGQNGQSSPKALFEAVGRGETAIVESALAEHADPNLQYTDGETLVMRAINKDRGAVVRLLISRGADVNKPDSFGCTPLMHAVSGDNDKIVSFLLTSGARVGDRAGGRFGRGDQLTALHYACLYGTAPIVKLLLSHGADVKMLDSFGSSPLHYSAERSDPQITLLLLKKGADVKLKNKGGHTPLDLAKNRAVSAILKAHAKKHPQNRKS